MVPGLFDYLPNVFNRRNSSVVPSKKSLKSPKKSSKKQSAFKGSTPRNTGKSLKAKRSLKPPRPPGHPPKQSGFRPPRPPGPPPIQSGLKSSRKAYLRASLKASRKASRKARRRKSYTNSIKKAYLKRISKQKIIPINQFPEIRSRNSCVADNNYKSVSELSYYEKKLIKYANYLWCRNFISNDYIDNLLREDKHGDINQNFILFARYQPNNVDLCGFIIFQKNKTYKNFIYIHLICTIVSTNYKGVGQSLLTKIEDIARFENFEAIKLSAIFSARDYYFNKMGYDYIKGYPRSPKQYSISDKDNKNITYEMVKYL